jgi:hypothetical protein
MNGIVKVVKIIDADRQAGYSTVEKPHKNLVGKIGIITRPLTQWDGYWVTFYFQMGNMMWATKQYVFDRSELVEATEEEIKEFDDMKKEWEDNMDAYIVADKL